jgi:hypothetical protein
MNCPKCGRFMGYASEPLPHTSATDNYWYCVCGHEEKVGEKK